MTTSTYAIIAEAVAQTINAAPAWPSDFEPAAREYFSRPQLARGTTYVHVRPIEAEVSKATRSDDLVDVTIDIAVRRHVDDVAAIAEHDEVVELAEAIARYLRRTPLQLDGEPIERQSFVSWQLQAVGTNQLAEQNIMVVVVRVVIRARARGGDT